MKRINSFKEALRNILPSSDTRPTMPPAPSYQVITIMHLYATDPQGILIKYPGNPIFLNPLTYSGGHLRYSTDGSVAYRAALVELVRAAKMTLLFAQSSGSWDLTKLQAELDYERGNGVECRMVPLLNLQSQGTAEMSSVWFNMNTGRFMRELMSSSASWSMNLALVVRWEPGRREDKPLPPLPTNDGESTVASRRVTIWPGPNAPSNNHYSGI